MSKSKIYEDINYQEIDTSKWPTVLVDNLLEDHREKFLLRKLAVDMYLENKSLKEIEDETGFDRNTPLKLLKRCLEFDENGEVYGYRALIPYTRIKTFSREFSTLLEKYPEIKEYIEQQYLGKLKKEISEKNMKISTLHKKFLAKCIRVGIKEHEYPFNTIDKAERSLYRYIKSLNSKYYLEVTKRHGTNAIQTFNDVGVGNCNNPIITRPFQQVQFDGHKIDAMIAIKFKTLEGDIIVKPMSRIWLLSIIDVATRVILGYHICLNTEYSSADVLKCIENSIIPKEKMKFSILGLKYPENGGYHSLCIPETKWALWDEFLYDNAKANLANNVTNALTNYIKCATNAGPVATPQRRGIIERFFKTLEERGFHRLISTTGSNINDPRRQDCEKKAIEYEISESEIEEIVEVLIADYNNTPHSSLNGFTPLDIMSQRIERGLIPRIMSESDRQNLSFFTLKVERQICGNIKEGRKPFINYEGVEYRSDVLSKMPDLIGTKLTLLVNINDLRFIKAYLPNGYEFGILTAKGKWSIKPHTLKMRKEINKLKKNKKINISMYDDPIEIYHTYLLLKAEENKTARNKLAKLNKIQEEKVNNSINKPKQNVIEIKSIDRPTSQLTNLDNNKIDKIKKRNLFKTLID